MNRTIWVLKKRIENSSPAILCTIASFGVIGTTITAIKATPKAEKLKKEANRRMLSLPEKILYIIPAYVPSIAIGSGTIICIFGANALNRRKQASLISAFAILEESYKEYRDKAAELLGSDSVKEITGEIVKDHLKKEEVEASPELPLFYDLYGNRYFNRTMEEVRDAEYHLNRNFILRGYTDLNEFYTFLGLEKTDFGGTVGWSMDAGFAFYGYQWIDFEHELITLEDGLECYVIAYPFEPHSDYLEL